MKDGIIVLISMMNGINQTMLNIINEKSNLLKSFIFGKL